MSKTQRDAVLYRQARAHLLACVFNLVTSKLWTIGYDVMESLKPVRRPFGSSSVLDSPFAKLARELSSQRSPHAFELAGAKINSLLYPKEFSDLQFERLTKEQSE